MILIEMGSVITVRYFRGRPTRTERAAAIVA
jgi:hypothetical protein